MPDFEDEIGQIVGAIQALSSTSFLFAGERVDAEEKTGSAATALTQNPAIVTRLQQHLYQHCYCNAFGSAKPQALPATVTAENFLAQLSQANLSRSRWDSNWQVTRVETTGQVWADKSRVVRIVQPGEFVK